MCIIHCTLRDATQHTLTVSKHFKNLKNILFIIILTLLSINLKGQNLDSTIFLNFRDTSIQAIKRYKVSYYDSNKKDTIDHAPWLYSLQFKETLSYNINVKHHPDTEYVENELGEITILPFETHLEQVNFSMGEISANALSQLLITPITLKDKKNIYFSNYISLNISTKSNYKNLNSNQANFNDFIKNEIPLLKKGDIVIISHLGFKLPKVMKVQNMFNGIYWTIK